MAHIGTVAVKAATQVKLEAGLMWTYLVKAMIAGLAIIIGMWALNIIGARVVNFIPLFAGAIALAAVAFHPKLIFIAMGTGAVVQGLRDEDITQGAILGVSTLFQAVFGIMFYFTFVALVLSVFPFARAPMTFWGLAAVLIVVSAFFAYVGGGSGNWRKAIVVCVLSLFTIVLILQVLVPDGFARWTNEFDRGVNHGDWSEPSGTVETIAGGTVTIYAGKPITRKVIGSATLRKPVDHCLDIAPAGTFTIIDEPFGTSVVIIPKSGRPTVGTFTPIPYYDC